MKTPYTAAEPQAPLYPFGDYHMTALNDEIDAASRMNRVTVAQVEAAPAEQAVTAAGIAMHVDSCRNMRRVITLARWTTIPVGALRADDAERRRKLVRARIIRGVEDAIHAKVADVEDSGRLREELYDRMDASDLEDDILVWQPDVVIKEICRDMGIGDREPGAHPWKRRTPEDVARLNEKAAEASGNTLTGLASITGRFRVLTPKIRPPRNAWLDQPDPDKPVSEWTDEELDRACERDGLIDPGDNG